MADIKILHQALGSIGVNPCDANPPVMWNGSSERAAEILAEAPTQNNLFVPFGDFLYFSRKIPSLPNPVWYRLNIVEDGCELFKPVFQSTVYIVEINIETPFDWRESNWTPAPNFYLSIMDTTGATMDVGNLNVGSNRFEITDRKPSKFKIIDRSNIYATPTSWENLTLSNGMYKGSYTLNYGVKSHTFNIDVLGAGVSDGNSGEIINVQGEVLEIFDFLGEVGQVTVSGIGVSNWTHPFAINMTWGPAQGQSYMIQDNTIAARSETWVPFNGSVEQTVCIVEVRFYWYQEPVTGMRVNFYDDTNYLYGNFTDDSGLASYTILDSSVPPPLLRIEVNHSNGSVGGGQSHVFVFDERFYNLDYTIDETVYNGIQYEIYHAVVNLQDYGNTLG
jgi:hypothetical protein